MKSRNEKLKERKLKRKYENLQCIVAYDDNVFRFQIQSFFYLILIFII